MLAMAFAVLLFTTVCIMAEDTPTDGGSAVGEFAVLSDGAAIPSSDDSVQSSKPAPTSPDSVPDFNAQVIVDEAGYGVLGTLADFPTDAIEIRPFISVDGSDYEETDYAWKLPDENVDENDLESLRSQICIRGWDEPFDGYLQGKYSAVAVKLRVVTADGGTYDTQSIQIEQGEPLDLPETPPAFETEIEFSGGNGWLLLGEFSDFTPDIQTVIPVYSLDGETYQADMKPDGNSILTWDLTRKNQHSGLESLTRQICALPSGEPFYSYLNGTLDHFYVKLHITTWSGRAYDTQPSRISRDIVQQPAELVAVASWPSYMLGRDGRGSPYYGKVQVTAREGMTAEDLRSLLPTTLPIDIQLMESNEKGELFRTVDQGTLYYPVEWTLPEDLLMDAQNEQVEIHNAIAKPVISAGQKVPMLNGIYSLTEGAEFMWISDEIRLFVNALPEDGKAAIALDDQTGDSGSDTLPLTLAFHQKPSGASAVRIYYCYENSGVWVEAGELLTQLSVDAKPGNQSSEYYTLFTPEQTPYKDYLMGEIAGFLVGVEIEGGIFDGELHTLKWPEDYVTPPHIPDFIGSGGNRNDAGSGGGDSNEGGQRPSLPQEAEEESSLTSNPESAVVIPVQAVESEEISAVSEQATQSVSAVKKDVQSDALDVPQEVDRTVPIWNEEPSLNAPVGEQQQTVSYKNVGIPIAVTVAIVLVGGGIAATFGAAGTTGTGGNGLTKLFSVLRKFFSGNK